MLICMYIYIDMYIYICIYIYIYIYNTHTRTHTSQSILYYGIFMQTALGYSFGGGPLDSEKWESGWPLLVSGKILPLLST